MGKLTDALRKAAEERIERIEKINRIREKSHLVIKKAGDSRVDPRIMTYFDPKALISEQYKILRTNLLSIHKGAAPKMLTVTSAIHSEGKTITALNLAMAMAQATKKPKVLLIDADVRRGRIARYLGVPPGVGLSEVLEGKTSLDEALFKLDVENLTFLASGAVPPNPVELLDSEQMKRLLLDVRQQFDYVIIDTPPIISVTDAGIIAASTDGVLMIIQAGRTQRGVIKRALELLEQAHSKVIGHVLTSIEYHLPEYIYRYL